MNDLSFFNTNIFPKNNVSNSFMGVVISPQFFNISKSFSSVSLRHADFFTSNIRSVTSLIFENFSVDCFCHNNTEKQNLNIFLFSKILSNSIAPHSNSPTASAEAEDLISVKEDLLRKSPNSLTRTFLNANIKSNLGFPSQSLKWN